MTVIPFVPITDPDQFSEIGSDVAQVFRRELHFLHGRLAEKHRTTDGGPLLSGAMAAIQMFVADTGGDWAEVQALLNRQADAMWPQIKAACDRQYDAARPANDGHRS